MNLDKRSKILLGILAFVLVLALWPEGGKRNTSASIDSTTGSGFRIRGRGPRRQAAPVKNVVTLNFDRLASPQASQQEARNPFEYKVAPRIIVVPDPKPQPDPIPVREVEVKPVEVVPTGPILPSMDHLKYIGNFGPKRGKLAVFRVSDEEILVVAQGDTLDQDFVLQSIGYESVDIGFLNFPDQPPERLAINQ